MKTYEINKKFASLTECKKWEEENCPNRTYNGEMILMISHAETCGSNEITLTNITTLQEKGE